MTKNNWAYYNISTDTIHGCEKGTLSYLHEEGHRDWAIKGREQMIQHLQWTIILTFLPIAVALTGNLLLALGSAVPLILMLLSEIHAWVYAFINWKK